MRIAVKTAADLKGGNLLSEGLKLDVHLENGILDATIKGYYYPDPLNYFELRPDLMQDHGEIKTIYYSWEQLFQEDSFWQNSRCWILTVNKNLPCIIEFMPHFWQIFKGKEEIELLEK